MEKQYELALSAYSRASGVQFLTFFAVFWLIGSLILPQQQIDHHVFQFNVLVVVFGGLFAMVIYLRSRNTKRSTISLAMSPLNARLAARRSRVFRWVNMGQYFALAIAGVLLSYIHRFDLFVPVGIFIVGAHFFPLAVLFKYPFHFATGFFLVGWATAYPHWLAAGSLNPLGLSVTGIILLLSACWASHAASKLAMKSRRIQETAIGRSESEAL
jgi:hypothetical protein